MKSNYRSLLHLIGWGRDFFFEDSLLRRSVFFYKVVGSGVDIDRSLKAIAGLVEERKKDISKQLII